jgi:DNA (cytosine-5)-methyltransferase 1
MTDVDLCPELRTISICSGGGGLDIGLELAIPGARPICFLEREAYAAAVLVEAMHGGLLAEAPVWSDVTTFRGRPWRGAVDCLVGGIPCQPHSLAGRRGGSGDERDLWSDARRIIVQARPWVVLIENVPGMLSAGKDEIAGAERVRRDLSRLGYQVEGGLFSAEEVGASQERERVFILGVADGHGQHEHRAGIEWQGRRGQSADGGDPLANAGDGRADGEPRNIRRAQSEDQPSQADGAERHVRDGGPAVEHTPRIGRREGRPEPELRCGRAAATVSGGDVECTDGGVGDGGPSEPWRRSPGRTPSGRPGQGHLFPPGPDDDAGWIDVLERHPEFLPALPKSFLRGLVDGLGGPRVERIRLLGNGVVPLQAAFAIRTLATRLAASGSVGAKQLVLMMSA